MSGQRVFTMLKRGCLTVLVAILLLGLCGGCSLLALKFGKEGAAQFNAAQVTVEAKFSEMSTPQPTEPARTPTSMPSVTEMPSPSPVPDSGDDGDGLCPGGWTNTREDSQEPKGCAATGMCGLSFDVPAFGFTRVIGAPMAFGEEIRLYDAGQRQAQVWIFYNPTETTVSVTMEAWSGANAVHGCATATVAVPPLDDLAEAVLEFLERGVRMLQEPGNCTVDGCALATIGYIVWSCNGNDSCSRMYTWNPAQDPGHTGELVPTHNDIYLP